MTPTANEMLAYLATAPEGMTTSHLADHCPSALDRTAVSRAAYQLRTAGLIHEVGRVPSHEGRGARSVAVYAISEAGRAHLSQAAAPECEACVADDAPVPVRDEDPVIAEIQDMLPNPSHGIEHAEAHAERLRTLAERLRLMDSRTTWTRAWLCHLADLLDPEAAQ